jgi:hypothetical protein
MSPSANRTATPAGINRNARLASLGSGGWLRLESPADFVGIRKMEAATAQTAFFGPRRWRRRWNCARR